MRRKVVCAFNKQLVLVRNGNIHQGFEVLFICATKTVDNFVDNSVSTKQSSSDTTSIPDQQAQDNKPEIQKNRRRKRVLKSKTYLNDEGYMGKAYTFVEEKLF